ncbi:hypothetical protein NMB32_02105 [Stenotrophomonas sp. CD2]|nr:hypothetical protein NMB32_02105 [Stenotrophomonas sp. CD2]
MGVMMVLSPLIGGLLSALWGWRAVFIAILPFLALLGYGTLRWIPESSGSVVRPLDPPGIITFSVAIFGIVFFLVEGLAEGWSSAPALSGLGRPSSWLLPSSSLNGHGHIPWSISGCWPVRVSSAHSLPWSAIRSAHR